MTAVSSDKPKPAWGWDAQTGPSTGAAGRRCLGSGKESGEEESIISVPSLV